MEQWEVNKPLGQCCGTGQQIECGQEYFAALVETKEGLQRQDFSTEYWETEKPQVYCYWKTKLPDPNQKKQIFIDDDMLMVFFERLQQETDQEKINFRFVIMLILMRRRKLKYDSTRTEDGKEIWHLRIVGSSDFVDVVNPNLSEEQIEQLSSHLGQILQTDL